MPDSRFLNALWAMSGGSESGFPGFRGMRGGLQYVRFNEVTPVMFNLMYVQLNRHHRQ
jgi:hypothetical protein